VSTREIEHFHPRLELEEPPDQLRLGVALLVAEEVLVEVQVVLVEELLAIHFPRLRQGQGPPIPFEG
jgi:hypothetical protein